MRKDYQNHQWLAITVCKCFSHRRTHPNVDKSRNAKNQKQYIHNLQQLNGLQLITKHSSISEKTMCAKEKGLFTCTPIKTQKYYPIPFVLSNCKQQKSKATPHPPPPPPPQKKNLVVQVTITTRFNNQNQVSQNSYHIL